MKTTVSEKGQITIPRAIRTRLGIVAGTVLELDTIGGKIVASKSQTEDPLGKWRGKGLLPGGLSVDDYLRRIRG
jgi:AbrB family looped-hinge helix DNA binding protein